MQPLCGSSLRLSGASIQIYITKHFVVKLKFCLKGRAQAIPEIHQSLQNISTPSFHFFCPTEKNSTFKTDAYFRDHNIYVIFSNCCKLFSLLQTQWQLHSNISKPKQCASVLYQGVQTYAEA